MLVKVSEHGNAGNWTEIFSTDCNNFVIMYFDFTLELGVKAGCFSSLTLF